MLHPKQSSIIHTAAPPPRKSIFSSIRKMLLFGLPLSLLLASTSTDAATYSATVSSTDQQPIKGWGCNADFDQAFPNRPLFQQALYVDLGLTMDRLQFGHDVGSDDQGNLVTSVMDKYCSRINLLHSDGLGYIICSWCPNINMKSPAQIGSNGAGTVGYLKTDHETQFENYFVNICNYIKNKGFPLPTALCVQNEPTTSASYDAMGFINEGSKDYSQYYRVIKGLRSKLDAAGLSAVKLLGPEDGAYNSGDNWGCSVNFLGGPGFPALNDSALNAALGGFSAHSYNWGGGTTALSNWRDGCLQWGKEKWMTEYSWIEQGDHTSPGQPLKPALDTAVWTSRRLCSDLSFVRNNYWFWWVGCKAGSSQDATYPQEELMYGDGTSTINRMPLYYVLQKVFTYAPPGSTVKTVTSNDPGLTVANAIWMDAVAFVNGNTTTVVLVNPQTSSRTTSVNGLTGTSAKVYLMNSSNVNQDMSSSTVAVSNGTISSITMPAWSVTVIVTGGGKYEAENLTVAAQTSGIPYRTVADSRFSNGSGTFFDATATGQYVTFDVPDVAVATYDVRVGVKEWNNKGQWQLAVSRMDQQGSPTNVGPVVDTYTAGETFTEVDLGNWTPGTTSDKAFRFTVTGKNASSTGYGLAFDYIRLIPQ